MFGCRGHWPLGGKKADRIGAGRERHRLTEAAQLLKKRDLAALGGDAVADSEAAAVAGNAAAPLKVHEEPVGLYMNVARRQTPANSRPES